MLYCPLGSGAAHWADAVGGRFSIRTISSFGQDGPFQYNLEIYVSENHHEHFQSGQ